MKHLLTTTAALALLAPILGACMSQDYAGYLSDKDGQSITVALPDQSQLSFIKASTAQDNSGIMQCNVLSTVRAYPTHTDIVSVNPTCGYSTGGWWLSAGVGLVQSGASELGGLALLSGGVRSPTTNISVGGSSATSTATGGKAVSNSGAYSTSTSNAQVHNVNTNKNNNTNVNSNFQQQQQQQQQPTLPFSTTLIHELSE